MPAEKISFVNGKPADCGCQIQYSSGGGEYSDVHYVTLCATHQVKRFGPVEVKRDEDGWWYHPDVPEFDEDVGKFDAWLKEQKLELKQRSMDADGLEDHPYWDIDSNCSGCVGWEPQSPGPEWFLLEIFDTEYGPYVSLVRRVVTL